VCPAGRLLPPGGYPLRDNPPIADETQDEDTMIRILIAACLSLFLAGAMAAGPSCADRAAAKKLSGAAKTSFIKKCEKDTKAPCELQATEKKLHGAARTSFVNKCVRDSAARAG